MKIKTVTVGLGRTFPDPFEGYANLRPSVTFEAELEEGDDPAVIRRLLDEMAKQALDEQLQGLVSARYSRGERTTGAYLTGLYLTPDLSVPGATDNRVCTCSHFAKDHQNLLGERGACMVGFCSCEAFRQDKPDPQSFNHE